jgi:1,4-dihydroxy-2-naphthoyl-CoA synthase
MKRLLTGADVIMTDELLYEVRDDIGRITFNRPQARNALTFAMYERLAAICAEINAGAAFKALVITGAGDLTACDRQAGQIPRNSRPQSYRM